MDREQIIGYVIAALITVIIEAFFIKLLKHLKQHREKAKKVSYKLLQFLLAFGFPFGYMVYVFHTHPFDKWFVVNMLFGTSVIVVNLCSLLDLIGLRLLDRLAELHLKQVESQSEVNSKTMDLIEGTVGLSGKMTNALEQTRKAIDDMKTTQCNASDKKEPS